MCTTGHLLPLERHLTIIENWQISLLILNQKGLDLSARTFGRGSVNSHMKSPVKVYYSNPIKGCQEFPFDWGAGIFFPSFVKLPTKLTYLKKYWRGAVERHTHG